MSYTAMMKKHIKFIIGVIFSIILLTLCESWLFSDSEINWLEPINEQPDFDDFEHFDWNGDVRQVHIQNINIFFTEILKRKVDLWYFS